MILLSKPPILLQEEPLVIWMFIIMSVFIWILGIQTQTLIFVLDILSLLSIPTLSYLLDNVKVSQKLLSLLNGYSVTYILSG